MPWTMRRQAARVILLDEALDHVFLINAEDPIDPRKGDWWETPGGGIHSNEPTASAGERELREEAGIVHARMGPCVATQHVRFEFAGISFDQDEWVHVAWVDEIPDDHRPMGLEALEAAAFMGHRWWPVEELLDSDVAVLPVRLHELLPRLVLGDLPPDPLDITPPADLSWP